jgi:hypothetical protein
VPCPPEELATHKKLQRPGCSLRAPAQKLAGTGPTRGAPHVVACAVLQLPALQYEVIRVHAAMAWLSGKTSNAKEGRQNKRGGVCSVRRTNRAAGCAHDGGAGRRQWSRTELDGTNGQTSALNELDAPKSDMDRTCTR